MTYDVILCHCVMTWHQMTQLGQEHWQGMHCAGGRINAQAFSFWILLWVMSREKDPNGLSRCHTKKGWVHTAAPILLLIWQLFQEKKIKIKKMYVAVITVNSLTLSVLCARTRVRAGQFRVYFWKEATPKSIILFKFFKSDQLLAEIITKTWINVN